MLHFFGGGSLMEKWKSASFSKKLPHHSCGSHHFWWKSKKTGENPGKILKKSLTSKMECDTMNLHSVLLCPFVPILICEIIISQNMEPVKWKILKVSTAPGVSICKQHINSGLGQKKGCEESYGNGQGHDVRQDHA